MAHAIASFHEHTARRSTPTPPLYQPIFNLERRRVVGMQQVGPEMFAASSSMDDAIRGIRFGLDFMRALSPEIYLSVDVPAEAHASPLLAEALQNEPRRTIIRMQLDPQWHVCESLMESLASLRRHGVRLKLGVRAAESDGWLALRPDLIELDARELVSHECADEQAGLRRMIERARECDAVVVATRVSRVLEIRAARSLGIFHACGDLLSLPTRAEEAARISRRYLHIDDQSDAEVNSSRSGPRSR